MRKSVPALFCFVLVLCSPTRVCTDDSHTITKQTTQKIVAQHLESVDELDDLESIDVLWVHEGNRNRSRGGVFLGTSWRKPLVFARPSKGGARSHRSRTEVECGGGKECPHC
jgi:hypothetical protein